MRVHGPAGRLLAGFVTRMKLRGCASVGSSISVAGRVWVHGGGHVHLGDGVVLDARAAPIELCAHPGAEIRIGPAVRIEGGASIEAVSHIEIEAEAKLGSFCKVLDNHLHQLDSAHRHRRPPSHPVVVEQRAEVGARAILLPGARIGRGAVVPRGAVISRGFGVPPSRRICGSEHEEVSAARPAQSDGGDASAQFVAAKIRAGMRILRALWYLRHCQCGARVRASGRVRVLNQGTIRVGDRTVFVGGMIPTELICRPGGRIEIGPSSLLNYAVSVEAWDCVQIGSRTMFGSLVRMSDRANGRAGPIVIGDDVWVAHGAVIEPGVTIGSRSVIGAGSVVSSDVPPDSLALGNPARCMRLDFSSDERWNAAATRPASVIG